MAVPTCQSGHGTADMVVQLIHFLTPYADGVCVEQLRSRQRIGCWGRAERQIPALSGPILWSYAPTFDVIFFSAISTTPSFAKMPIAAPALEMASMAYSTWYSLPSGLKIVVRES